MAGKSLDEFNERLDKALEPDCPKVYFNGFANALGTGDVVIVLERHNRPAAVLSRSFTVAKTLSRKLGTLIAGLEDASKRPIMTTEDVLEFQTSHVEEKTVVSKKAGKKKTGSTGATRSRGANGRGRK